LLTANLLARWKHNANKYRHKCVMFKLLDMKDLYQLTHIEQDS